MQAIDVRFGTVTIKFFNVLIKDLGLRLLSKGVTMADADLKHLLEHLPPDQMTVWINGEIGSLETLYGDCRHRQSKGASGWMLHIAEMQ